MFTTKKMKKVGVCMAVAAGAWLGSAPAHAVSYGVSLDPAFGAIFPDLSWSASGVLDLNAACLNGADGNYSVSGDCAGTQFTSMEVTFFKTGFPGGAEQQTFNALVGPVTISRLVIQNHELTQINAGFFSDFGPTCGTDASCSIAGNGDYTFAMVLAGADFAHDPSANFGRIFYGMQPGSGQDSAICAAFEHDAKDCGVSEFNATVTITPVPEPQTYALMLAGLASLGLMARRRRQA